jgi:triphosphoribosyl-dephospho-CoA synthase
VVALYLEFLARFKDSHIERKLGTVAAQRVRLEAQRLVENLDVSSSSEMNFEDLMRFDRLLKRRRINPGTSADMTVATLLAGNLLREEGNRVAARPARDAAGIGTT